MSKKKYTFLLPAYKKQFLYESIKSILSQNYRNFRVLVSDDCSPEDLKSVVDAFNDNRITYRRNKQNLGARRLVYHWNMLLNMTDSEFVIMASDDDIYLPDFLTTIDELQCQYPSVDLLRARIQHINEGGDVIWKERPLDEYQNPLEAICECPDTCVPNYVFRRSRLVEVGGFVDFPYAMGSDTATAMLMSEKGVVNTSYVQFSYRLSSSQISHHSRVREVDKEKLKGALEFYKWQSEFIHSRKIDSSLFHNHIVNDCDERIKRVLVGTCRFYYGALSYMSFFKLLKQMKFLGCFKRNLEVLGFVIGYWKSRKWYK